MISATVNFHGTKKELRKVSKKLFEAGFQGLKRAAKKGTGAPAKVTAALLSSKFSLPANEPSTIRRKNRRRGAKGPLLDSKKYARSWRGSAKRINSKTARLKIWPGGRNKGVDNALLSAYLHYGTRHHKAYPHLKQVEKLLLEEATALIAEEVRRVFGS